MVMKPPIVLFGRSRRGCCRHTRDFDAGNGLRPRWNSAVDVDLSGVEHTL